MNPFPQAPASLPDLLARAARSFGDRTITILDGRGRNATQYSYAELHERVRTAARHWAGVGLAPGEPVLVSLPTSIEWFDAWFGAAFAGGVPVATAPAGGFGGGEAAVQKIEGLLERLDTRWAVVTRGMQRNLRTKTVTHDDLEAASPSAPGTPHPDAPAFLQFTSGSTGWPRAVMIPHSAAVHNPHAIDLAIGTPQGAPTHEWAKTVVSWLPLFHDMGLVGCFLFALYCGHDFVVMPPTVFLARPRVWLERLADSQQVLSPAPNFGYQYCVERIGSQEFDLSGWRAAMTGAEMIRPETVAAFEERFGPGGFASEAFRPCYGLAEATLAVTFDTSGKGVRTGPDGHVCVGTPVADTEVRCDDDGAVEARGPGIFSGYYRDDEASMESLRDGWLRTGDLGFMQDGELTITGRTKDVLILRGNNVMPHELEWEAEAVTGGGGATRAAAFSVDGGAAGEQAVLVVEAESPDEETERAIKVRVGRSLGIVLADVRFVRRGRLPRTTSGKVQRGEVRRLYESGELE
jgi:acyl-CoA synthetase (AMP-forming)/AMP-acid ligase II